MPAESTVSQPLARARSLLIAIRWYIYGVFAERKSNTRERARAFPSEKEGCVGSSRGCWRSCTDGSTCPRELPSFASLHARDLLIPEDKQIREAVRGAPCRPPFFLPLSLARRGR